MTDNTTETIFSEVYYSLLEDYKNGIIHCGTNGPYDDPETKVRNLCNLIIASCAKHTCWEWRRGFKTYNKSYVS